MNMTERDIALNYVDRLRKEDTTPLLSGTLCPYLSFSSLLSLKNTCTAWHDDIAAMHAVRVHRSYPGLVRVRYALLPPNRVVNVPWCEVKNYYNRLCENRVPRGQILLELNLTIYYIVQSLSQSCIDYRELSELASASMFLATKLLKSEKRTHTEDSMLVFPSQITLLAIKSIGLLKCLLEHGFTSDEIGDRVSYLRLLMFAIYNEYVFVTQNAHLDNLVLIENELPEEFRQSRPSFITIDSVSPNPSGTAGAKQSPVFYLQPMDSEMTLEVPRLAMADVLSLQQKLPLIVDDVPIRLDVTSDDLYLLIDFLNFRMYYSQKHTEFATHLFIDSFTETFECTYNQLVRLTDLLKELGATELSDLLFLMSMSKSESQPNRTGLSRAPDVFELGKYEYTTCQRSLQASLRDHSTASERRTSEFVMTELQDFTGGGKSLRNYDLDDDWTNISLSDSNSGIIATTTATANHSNNNIEKKSPATIAASGSSWRSPLASTLSPASLQYFFNSVSHNEQEWKSARGKRVLTKIIREQLWEPARKHASGDSFFRLSNHVNNNSQPLSNSRGLSNSGSAAIRASENHGRVGSESAVNRGPFLEGSVYTRYADKNYVGEYDNRDSDCLIMKKSVRVGRNRTNHSNNTSNHNNHAPTTSQAIVIYSGESVAPTTSSYDINPIAYSDNKPTILTHPAPYGSTNNNNSNNSSLRNASNSASSIRVPDYHDRSDSKNDTFHYESFKQSLLESDDRSAIPLMRDYSEGDNSTEQCIFEFDDYLDVGAGVGSASQTSDPFFAENPRFRERERVEREEKEDWETRNNQRISQQLHAYNKQQREAEEAEERQRQLEEEWDRLIVNNGIDEEGKDDSNAPYVRHVIDGDSNTQVYQWGELETVHQGNASWLGNDQEPTSRLPYKKSGWNYLQLYNYNNSNGKSGSTRYISDYTHSTSNPKPITTTSLMGNVLATTSITSASDYWVWPNEDTSNNNHSTTSHSNNNSSSSANGEAKNGARETVAVEDATNDVSRLDSGIDASQVSAVIDSVRFASIIANSQRMRNHNNNSDTTFNEYDFCGEDGVYDKLIEDWNGVRDSDYDSDQPTPSSRYPTAQALAWEMTLADQRGKTSNSNNSASMKDDGWNYCSIAEKEEEREFDAFSDVPDMLGHFHRRDRNEGEEGDVGGGWIVSDSLRVVREDGTRVWNLAGSDGENNNNSGGRVYTHVRETDEEEKNLVAFVMEMGFDEEQIRNAREHVGYHATANRIVDFLLSGI